MTERAPPIRSAKNGFTLPWRSAQQGFTLPWRSAKNGFTLIEMLVALMIFALLATAGVLLLRGSVDAQTAVGRHLDDLAAVQRGLATFDADLAQARMRISRTRDGKLAPAFFGRTAQHDAPLMQFVRGGWSNPDDQRRSSLQKVEYWWRDDKIERVGYPAVDGAAPADPATLFDHVTALAVRYRDDKGVWHDDWQPGDPQAMPSLVELVITRTGAAALRVRFLVGATIGQGEAPPPTAPDDTQAVGGPQVIAGPDSPPSPGSFGGPDAD